MVQIKTLLVKKFSVLACDHHVLEYPIVAWTAPPFMADSVDLATDGSLSSAESRQ